MIHVLQFLQNIDVKLCFCVCVFIHFIAPLAFDPKIGDDFKTYNLHVRYALLLKFPRLCHTVIVGCIFWVAIG